MIITHTCAIRQIRAGCYGASEEGHQSHARVRIGQRREKGDGDRKSSYEEYRLHAGYSQHLGACFLNHCYHIRV